MDGRLNYCRVCICCCHRIWMVDLIIVMVVYVVVIESERCRDNFFENVGEKIEKMQQSLPNKYCFIQKKYEFGSEMMIGEQCADTFGWFAETFWRFVSKKIRCNKKSDRCR
jgi:hypothetical protein